MKILSKQNFNQNESKNFVVDNLSSAPSNPILGQVYYNTQNERAYVCIKSGETPEWADLSLQEEVSIGGEEPNGRDMKIWINPEDITSSSDYGSLPIGSIIPYSGTTAPEGYSICDGKELNRETYKELFSIIGTTFGNGDNSTTFNLPNLAGRISVGLDSSDTNFDIIGKTGGGNYEKRVKISSVSYGAFEGTSIPYKGQMLISTVKNTETSAQTLESNGIDFKQPYIVLNYIIKIYGEAMLTGDVIDSLEGDSSYNAPSVHAVNAKMKELVAPSYDGLPVGSEFDYDGTEIPDGFVQIDDPNTYSSEEVVIGTWFGKKLYRKTLYKSPLIHGTQETINHGIQNVDKIWQDISMSFAIWPTGFQANIPFLNNVTYDSSIFLYEINSTSFKLKSSLDRSNLSGYITLLYTKTTD